MIGKSPNQNEGELFRPLLKDFIDMNHELALLADRIDWRYFEKEFAPLYSKTGCPAMPVRFMVGCMMLKHMYNLGDETLAEAWVMNPYFQYFTGAAFFEHKFPCDPSDFVHFRKRIGESGFQKIFEYSVKMSGKKAEEPLVVSDTTVQGNNTTFPTDARLYKKVIDGCNKIAHVEDIPQRQTYTKTSKELLRMTYNSEHPKRHKKAAAAMRKLHTIAGRQVRELERVMTEDQRREHEEELIIYNRVLSQTRHSKDKVYSVHKPHTACIAKGKASHRYEFGQKVGMILTAQSQIIVAIKAFEGNPHDSKTVEPLLEQMASWNQKLPETLAYDRGGRGAKEVMGVKVITPGKPKKSDTAYDRKKKRYPFRRRAGIEPVFGHLKTDHRMQDNFLSGRESASINAMLAATGWNLKKMMKDLAKKSAKTLFVLLQILFGGPQYKTTNCAMDSC
ncbi:MAG: IS5 family transposase [Bacteroidales bacterium]|jgi:IS5 family transposase|nr:IS5 family transposase [Bacteroidales bacterium]MCH3940874.1 IS5 family transposase [Bacteroidales bacterium]MCH3941441.1 IS5 family transposase [Bacteroidales bacterium]MDY6320461.1 IS5 family transposase [Bacteroidales bacterium]